MIFRFYVDGTPVRVFKNKEEELGGVVMSYHYPNNQAMRIYSISGNAYDWETRGGLVKMTGLSSFVASFNKFNSITSSNSTTEKILDSKQRQRH